MAWSLATSSLVSSQLQAGEQGLLIAAVEASSKAVTVLGSVPVAAGGFQEAAGVFEQQFPHQVYQQPRLNMQNWH